MTSIRKKLLFNASVIQSEGGVSLLFSFVDSFLEAYPQLDITVYLNPKLESRFRERFGDSYRFKDRLNIIAFNTGNGLKRLLWEQFSLPKLCKQNKFDILFSFGNTGPLFPGCTQILYMHQPVPYTPYKPPSHRLKWESFSLLFKSLVGLAQWGSKKIVVQTSWLIPPLRQSVLNTIPASRYVVAKPGLQETIPDLSNEQKNNANSTELALIEALKQVRQNGQKILFYPTFLSPYKHIPYLLESLSRLNQKASGQYLLILTINQEALEYFPCKQAIFEKIKVLQLDESSLLLSGSLSRSTIDSVYGLSDALVFPSQAETLGMPLLEAMNRQLPIIATDVDYAREVCGKAALYADANSPEQFAQCIIDLFSSAETQAKLKQSALEQAKHYSWQNNAKIILEPFV